MKNIKINGIILFVVTLAILIYVLKDNFNLTFKILGSANFGFILIAVIMYIVAFSFETLILKNLVKQYKPGYKLSSAFKLTIMTKFFNGITPFSAGGRPLQIIEFKRKGVRVSDGTNVIIQSTIIFQSAFLLLSLVLVLLDSYFNFFSYDKILRNMLYLGFLFNGSLLIGSFVISISKTFNQKMVKLLIRLLAALKIVRNKEKQLLKWETTCDEYYNSFQSFKSSKALIAKGILFEIIALLFEYSVPVFVFLALGETTGLNIFTGIMASNFTYLSGCYIPIPGGTGGMEYSFLGYFGNFASKALLSPALILWRFIGYYLPTLIGGIAFNIKKRRRDNEEKEA